MCAPLIVKQDPNEYKKQTLYEVDISKLTPKQQSLIYSTNIGSALSWLHESELDFASSRVQLGGIITGIEDRPVTWYVQTTSNVSSSKTECVELSHCIASLQTLGGIAKFQGLDLKTNTLYHICADVDDTHIIREGTTLEHIEGFKVCGDGFIIDNTAPDKGTVTIISNKGYVATNEHLTIEWKGFQDVHDVFRLGYPSGISYYSYAIG